MNKKRRAKKAFQLGEYYFYKKQDDCNAILNYRKAIELSDLYSDSELVHMIIAKSYRYL